MAKLSTLDRETEAPGGAGMAGAVLADGASVAIPLGDMVDLGRECARLAAETARLEELIGKQEARLANPDFTTRAPAPVVARERDKLAGWREQVAVLREKQRKLGC